MSVEITYHCSGCEAKTTVTNVEAECVVLAANIFTSEGVVYKRPSIASVAPKGWMVYDPYTLLTYCPECWSAIKNGTKTKIDDKDET